MTYSDPGDQTVADSTDPKQQGLFEPAPRAADAAAAAYFADKALTQRLDHLREMSNEPIRKCSCCGGNSKVYAYRLGSYARVMIWMVFQGDEYLHIPSSGAINGGGDYAKLRHWKLIEESPTTPDPTKRSNGLWKLTAKGRDFALNKTTVSGVCYYKHPDGGVMGFEPEQVGIADVLGKHFDYQMLMDGYGVG
jgi:hypothetical protein